MNFNSGWRLISICGVAISLLVGVNLQKLVINIAPKSATDITIVRQEPPTTDSIFVSFREQLEESRKKSELLDDDTEKLLLRRKKWFLLAFLVFVWIAYQSLTMKDE
ncbi:MAG: hypothetical protein QNJ32_03455 [Xenococcaceae cyanobacterium MO_167.B27]|nr:hypothetical protein [Xenococcaceae cyanobacterium MO_167.B27]